MKLLRTSKDRFVFHVGKRERQLLFETLQLYPLVPAAHHRIAQPDQFPNSRELQEMLEEALAENRRENRKQVVAMLTEPDRFREKAHGFELILTRPQIEWLLQVLNDVRVGSWLALGEPEPDAEPELNEQNARYLLALEVCGMFQSMLLAALGVEQSSQWG